MNGTLACPGRVIIALSADADMTIEASQPTSAEFFGDVNGVRRPGNLLWGWAFDKRRPDVAITILVRIGGRDHPVLANGFRADLKEIGHPAHHGFEFPMPADLPIGRHRVEVLFPDGATLLRRGDFTFEQTVPQVPSHFSGDVNGLKEPSNVIWGWALDNRDATQPIVLIVRVGEAEYEVSADLFRADLHDRGRSAYHGFEFQIPSHLEPGSHSIEVLFPDRRTRLKRGSFVFEVSSRTQMRSQASQVRPATGNSESVPAPAVAPDLTSPDYVASLGIAEIVKVLVLSRNGMLTRDVLTHLHGRREHRLLWLLHDALASEAQLSHEDDQVRATAILALLFFGRIMLDLNASDSALAAFAKLERSGGLERLSPEDQRRFYKFLSRANLRSGHVDAAVDALRQALMRYPLDWELYFQLGGILGALDPRISLSYFRRARSVAKALPRNVLMAIADCELQTGDTDASIELCLLNLKSRTDAGEFHLLLANAYRKLGDNDMAAAHQQAFFKAFGLAPCTFSSASEGGKSFQGIVCGEAQVVEGPQVVTVIMTTFNSEATLLYSATSVLNQTYRNLRLIIVDDASDDGTAAIARALAERDPRVRVMPSTVNSGTYVAKNLGMQNAESDFITFHDSDDWMHPQRLEKSIEFLEGRPELQCVTSQWFRADASGNVAVRRAGGILHENPASTFFRSGVVDALGYFDSVRTGADSEFVWRIRRLFGARSVAEMKAPLTIGLLHEASLTSAGVAAFDEHRFSAVRLAYWESWVAWHRELARHDAPDARIGFPLAERRFEAPEAILP